MYYNYLNYFYLNNVFSHYAIYSILVKLTEFLPSTLIYNRDNGICLLQSWDISYIISVSVSELQLCDYSIPVTECLRILSSGTFLLFYASNLEAQNANLGWQAHARPSQFNITGPRIQKRSENFDSLGAFFI